MKKYITIIGSRNITSEEKRILTSIADKLHAKGYILRSGGADGSDSCINHLQNVQIIIPWNGYNNLIKDSKRIWSLNDMPYQSIARELIQKHHPAFSKLTPGALKLHMRNVYEITGPKYIDTTEISECVIYCADIGADGLPVGGTRTALSIAIKNNIPTYNIRSLMSLQILQKIYDIEV